MKMIRRIDLRRPAGLEIIRRCRFAGDEEKDAV